MMNEAETSLRPAISKLPGCISFFVSTDKTSNRFDALLCVLTACMCSLINASVWDSMAHALQMNTLPQMLALFAPFTDAGLAFERPIVNYEVDWQINDGKQVSAFLACFVFSCCERVSRTRKAAVLFVCQRASFLLTSSRRSVVFQCCR